MTHVKRGKYHVTFHNLEYIYVFLSREPGMRPTTKVEKRELSNDWSSWMNASFSNLAASLICGNLQLKAFVGREPKLPGRKRGNIIEAPYPRSSNLWHDGECSWFKSRTRQFERESLDLFGYMWIGYILSATPAPPHSELSRRCSSRWRRNATNFPF